MTLSLWGLSAPAWLSAGDYLRLLPLAVASVLFLLFRPKTPGMGTFVIALFLILFAAHFWILRSHSGFLGDGAVFLTMIRNHELFYPSNLLDFFLHARLYQAILHPLGLAPILSYALLGGAAGILFLFSMTAAVRLWTQGSAVQRPLLLFLLFTGYSALFFGYVESYALLFAVAAFYLYTGMRALRHQDPVFLPLLLFLLAVTFHQTALLLLPSLLFLIRSRAHTAGLARREILIGALITIAVPALFVAAFSLLGFDFRNYLSMLRERGVEGSTGLFLPLLKGDHPALSWSHILDFFNAQVLASPAATLLLPILIFSRRKHLSDPLARFLLLCAVPLYLFFFLLDSKIGLFRDWDLFSLPALPATLLAGFLLTRETEARRTATAGIIVLLPFLFLHAGSWILLNHNEESSFNRFKALVESPGRKPSPALQAHNFEQIADHYRSQRNLDQEQRYRLKAAEADSNPRHFNNLGNIEAERENWLEARRYYELALSRAPRLFETHFNLGRVYYKLGEPESTVNSFARAVAIRPENITALGCLGDAYAHAGRKEEALATYGRILKIAPENMKVRGAMENLEDPEKKNKQ